MKIKNDRYRKSRGGYSRILDICCATCSTHICYYQKDGPGPLKRMYLDRILMPKDIKLGKRLVCPNDNEILGTKTVYKKEGRPAIRLFVGSVQKSIVKKVDIEII